MSAVIVPWARDLPAVCKDTDSLTCSFVWDWTGNERLAQASAWLIGKPAACLGLLLLGFLVRWLVHRLIDRIVKRAEQGVIPGRLGNQQRSGDTPATAASRRAARAQGLGSLLKSITTVVVFGIVIVMMLDQIGLNVAPDKSVLILVDPAARQVEVVTGAQTHAELTDDEVRLAVAEMTAMFAEQELVDGIITGVNAIARFATN